MNRCPSCQTLVGAGWLTCRKCGGKLPIELLEQSPLPRVPESVRRVSRPSIAHHAPSFGSTRTSDTLLPGTPVKRPDTFLPPVRPEGPVARFVRRYRRSR